MPWQTIAQNPIAFSQVPAIDLSGSFLFDWFDLSDCWELSIDTANYDDMNRISLDTYDAPRIDWGGVLWLFVRGKILNIKLIVIRDTEEELNETIDNIKLRLFKKEGILKIKINDKFREVKANLTNISFNRDFEKKTILSNVTISFTTMENFYEEEATYNTEVGVDSPTLSLDINNTGARTDYRLYFIFGTGISGTDEITIEKDGYTLTINQSIDDNWILVVDWVNKQVLYNGTAIDYDWPFVQIENWSNPILISINGTYIADITRLYNVNYL